MKRGITLILSLVVAALVAVAYIHFGVNAKRIIIKGRIVGSRSNTLYLERHNGVTQSAIDTIELQKDGLFRVKIDAASADPTLYELHCGDEKIPLLARGGERITVNSIGSLAHNYTIKGSVESELLRSFYQPYVSKGDELKALASKYAAKQRRGEDVTELNESYQKLYREIKREQLKFTVTNKSYIAAIYALLQHLPGDNYLVNANSDLIYQQAIASAVAERYPNSQYLSYLYSIIEEREAQYRLLKSVHTINYPEISLYDRFGEKIDLSSLDGEPIIVDFWVVNNAQSNLNNAEMKELYSKYSDAGLKVYQVGIVSDRSQWIEAIQQQRLPWISVSDLKGMNSSVLSLYNVNSVPSNIIISKSGDIVGRNIFGDKLERCIKQELDKMSEGGE